MLLKDIYKDVSFRIRNASTATVTVEASPDDPSLEHNFKGIIPFLSLTNAFITRTLIMGVNATTNQYTGLEVVSNKSIAIVDIGIDVYYIDPITNTEVVLDTLVNIYGNNRNINSYLYDSNKKVLLNFIGLGDSSVEAFKNRPLFVTIFGIGLEDATAVGIPSIIQPVSKNVANIDTTITELTSVDAGLLNIPGLDIANSVQRLKTLDTPNVYERSNTLTLFEISQTATGIDISNVPTMNLFNYDVFSHSLRYQARTQLDLVYLPIL